MPSLLKCRNETCIPHFFLTRLRNNGVFRFYPPCYPGRFPTEPRGIIFFPDFTPWLSREASPRSHATVFLFHQRVPATKNFTPPKVVAFFCYPLIHPGRFFPPRPHPSIFSPWLSGDKYFLPNPLYFLCKGFFYPWERGKVSPPLNIGAFFFFVFLRHP